MIPSRKAILFIAIFAVCAGLVSVMIYRSFAGNEPDADSVDIKITVTSEKGDILGYIPITVKGQNEVRKVIEVKEFDQGLKPLRGVLAIDPRPEQGAQLVVHIAAPGLGDGGWSTQVEFSPGPPLRLLVNEQAGIEVDLSLPAAEPAPKSMKKGRAAEPGDIEVLLFDEDSNPVKGAKVELELPGPNGSRDKLPNSLMALTDGGRGDADELENGRVLFLAKYLKGQVKPGDEYLIAASADGYVARRDVAETYSDNVNTQRLALIKRAHGK